MTKNYDYIASIEKAIAEKYGKETVQDFRAEWDEKKEDNYLEQLKEVRKNIPTSPSNSVEVRLDDYSTIRRNKYKNLSRICPVCKTYSFSMKDDLYMNRFDCCFGCYIDFVEDREDRWKEDKRPDPAQVNAALRRRK